MRACVKCSGKFFKEEYGMLICLQCGKHVLKNVTPVMNFIPPVAEPSKDPEAVKKRAYKAMRRETAPVVVVRK